MRRARPREGLRDVEPYAAPQLEVAARLNTNECPHPLPEDFSRDLAQAVRDLPLNRYPDREAERLREELAEHAGHAPEGTWAANGSNEIIQQLLLAYGGPGRRMLVFEPTYVMHRRIAWIAHTEVVQLRLDPPFAIDSGDVQAAVAERPDVVFVCSPNNPTGNTQPVWAVEELAEATNALVVVDEAYVEFGGQSALPLTERLPNVVVVRTFSKAFAMAGARMGYCLTDPSVIDDLRRVRLPYHLSAITQAAGLAALHHVAEAEAILGWIRDERDRIVRELGAMDGVEVFPSDANFVLFRSSRPAQEVWQGLLDRGVLVRDLSDVVDGALRVTAGAAHEIDLFLEAMKEVLAG
ncbi:MAG TPA: histidinol-phosphate transaminase [Actinomycetota bacterium]|nr:histidinol-phosphate transaminase [Actinomycetota bacterium]